MNLQNVKRIQHFVSQAEQRLNAMNPKAKKRNQRIYSFSVQDRESYSVNLDQENGGKIYNTLSLNDLFSFDVLEGMATRYNFEDLFSRYEEDIRMNTDSLLSKLSAHDPNINQEILNLFVSKFVNFIRNPYSIKKVLSTFPSLSGLKPTEPLCHENFERVLNGRKPQQKHLCEELGITDTNYRDWLATIFMLLSPFEDGQRFFLEDVVKDLFENQDLAVTVVVNTYSNKTCLLSDKGYSISLEDSNGMAFDFNLYSNGFIRYGFITLDSLTPDGTPKEIIKTYKEMPKKVYFQRKIDDFIELKNYNRNVVHQCYSKVFNAKTECYGLA